MNSITQLSILIALKNTQDSVSFLTNLSTTFKASFVIESEENALQKVKETIPDFIIVEGSEGLAITKNIKSIPQCYTKCIVCLPAFDEDVIINAIFTNADAYFLKTSTNHDITDCLTRLLGGERYITPSFANNFLQNPKIDRYKKTIEKLSNREQEFFRYYGYHYSVKQIAHLMFISENTVNAHKNKVIEKLDLSGSRELKQLAAELLNKVSQ